MLVALFLSIVVSSGPVVIAVQQCTVLWIPLWDLPILQKLTLLALLLAEFNKVCSRTAIGFILMGFIGFFVKLIFIVSGSSASGTVANQLLL